MHIATWGICIRHKVGLSVANVCCIYFAGRTVFINFGAATHPFYCDTGRLADAKKSYLEAVRIKPDFAVAWSNLGGVFKSQKDYKSAVSYYEEAIRVDPEFSDAHNNLGAVLHEMNKISEAKKSFETAIRIRPDFAIAHGNLANCLFTP